ncbi:trihelix transcription factor DF1-like [Cornus florida]|uniref:trihelix transcription factor DF1-like n=1 Tax=Cornus florida TaxID=4283 RepID=UPI00289C9F6E|nr:trihelix transcription factor DF1-like [Cornus florida]
MLGATELLGNSPSGSGGGTASAAVVNLKNEVGSGGGSVSGGFGDEERGREEEGDRNFAGNRWPREETLALLKIRSDMDVAFRDSAVKAPLWDEVSRKLAELGYHRSAKKCKEKFENIYKYHKRTKEGRSGRQNGKSYRFFEQLELFDNQSSLPSPSENKIVSSMTETTMEMAAMVSTRMEMLKPMNVSQGIATCSIQTPNLEFMSTSTSTTSSSGKESQGTGKRKRKMADYFERLMKSVLEKQEDLQNKFIEALEKCENDRIAREEAWKMQELARMKREQEMLAHGRAVAAAKDAALVALLKKISEQDSPVQLPPENPTPISEKLVERQENNVGENSFQASPSRWPKAEVEALIRLRTNLDLQYQDNGPKGPLWEEISSAMKKIGYDRSAKRCKEKWENINKYFKRVRESNKKRPEDSKTCPYFHMLESLYEQKSKRVDNSDSSGYNLKPEDILLQMMGHQEPQQQQQQRDESITEDGGSENVDQNQEDDEDGDDDDDNGDDYQIVANNPSSGTTME